jgi:pyruvate dehydrogenase E2 component (dihydrolipoamide acetyltransferase)
MSEFKMPSLGADMASGKLLEWMVKPGDRVKRGQVMAVVGTEKGDIEVEVFEDGVVGELLATVGQEVPVGDVLATVRGAGEPEVAAPAAVPVAPPVAAAVAPAPVAVPAQAAVAGGGHNGHRVRVSPLARKLAEELGVDLSVIQGTGPGGAIDRHDVERAAAQRAAAPAPPPPVAPPPAAPPPVAPPPAPVVAQAPAAPPAPAPAEAAPTPPVAKEKGSEEFQAGMRRAIALAMARSNRDIPHYYLEQRIDMSAALKWLEAENQKRSIQNRVLPAVLLIKAVARALTQVPQLNGFWIDDRLQVQEGIHIGFAIALRQGGLVTPAIHNADLLGADDMMAALRDLIMRTRAGRLRSSELTDPTIVVTSLGDMGVDKVFGVIYPPQVALVGFGKISDQAWVENGMIGVRPVVVATVAGDHRATDGRVGAALLDALTAWLQKPEALWE